jgi:hypothetical protein
MDVELINSAGERVRVPLRVKIGLKRLGLLEWKRELKSFRISADAAQFSDLLQGFDPTAPRPVSAIDYRNMHPKGKTGYQNAYARLGLTRLMPKPGAHS